MVDEMPYKNKQWALTVTILSVVVSGLVILGYIGGGVDGRIDEKIDVHTAETELIHQQNINSIKTDIAVIKERQEQAVDDIGEIKQMMRDSQ